MKTLYRCISFLAIGGVGMASAPAADRIHFQTDNTITPAVHHELDVEFGVAQGQLGSGAFDSRAESLLKASELFTKTIFTFSTLQRRKASTYQKGNSDEMLVEWSFAESFGNGTLLLRDTPFLSQYMIKLDNCDCRSKDTLARLLTAVVAWAKPPVNVGGIDIRISANYPNATAFSGGPSPIFSETEVIRDFNFWGDLKDQDLYLSINVGKSHTQAYYPVPPFVPERFPPLSALLESWSSQHIWGEVGRPAGPSADVDLSDRRDAMLITELVRRGLSQDEYLELLRSAPPARLYARARIVFESLTNAGKSEDVIRNFEPTVQMYEKIGPRAESTVFMLFMEARRQGVCSAQIEKNAVRLVKEEVFQDSAISYLGRCSTSPEAAHLIDGSSVRDKFVAQTAIRDIRKRIGKDQ